jgi:hypothetical protein
VGFGSARGVAVKWPGGPFEACVLVVLVTAPRFASVVSTASIKVVGDHP